MKFHYYDLAHLSGGETVVVTLSGNAMNVRLMDSSNYESYRSGRSHRYIGGLAERSPVRLGVPRSGHWYVTLDHEPLVQRDLLPIALQTLFPPRRKQHQPGHHTPTSVSRQRNHRPSYSEPHRRSVLGRQVYHSAKPTRPEREGIRLLQPQCHAQDQPPFSRAPVRTGFLRR
ncbi:MAG: DUF1883 domain-containing protein [Limisphaerales bacterium]